MVISGLAVDGTQGRVELSFVTTTSGVQCAMTCGQTSIVTWSADSLGSLQLVHT